MRVVVTSDGSVLSERGLAAVAPLVRGWGAEVLLLTVLDPDAPHGTVSAFEFEQERPNDASARARVWGAPVSPAPKVVEDRGRALESARQAAEDDLHARAARHLAGSRWEVHVTFSSDAAGAIAQFAREKAAQLIVMSTHGRSGVGQALLGSTTAAVIRQSTVPVVVVGSKVELDGSESRA